MKPRRIVIDGKSYNSVDEMPEDVKRNYEEAMRGFKDTNPAQGTAKSLSTLFIDGDSNGVPDIMEQGQAINLTGGMKFVVDGQTYDSLEALPPEACAKYEQAMGAVDRNQNGMPEFLEGMMNVSTPSVQAKPAFDDPAEPPRRTAQPPQAVPPPPSPRTPPTAGYSGWQSCSCFFYVPRVPLECGISSSAKLAFD
jgi:hypothetical protein